MSALPESWRFSSPARLPSTDGMLPLKPSYVADSPVTRCGVPLTVMASQSAIAVSALQLSVAVPRSASFAASSTAQSSSRSSLPAPTAAPLTHSARSAAGIVEPVVPCAAIAGGGAAASGCDATAANGACVWRISIPTARPATTARPSHQRSRRLTRHRRSARESPPARREPRTPHTEQRPRAQRGSGGTPGPCATRRTGHARVALARRGEGVHLDPAPERRLSLRCARALLPRPACDAGTHERYGSRRERMVRNTTNWYEVW